MSHDTEAAPETGAIDMLSACAHAEDMSKMVQIRNVPESLHRELKSRAALAGKSLSEYLTEQLWRIAQKPSREEFLRRLRQDPPCEPPVPVADIIREMRGPLP